MSIHETLELRRQERQLALDGERSQAERNQLGQFATPETLAVEMAELARDLWRPRTPIRFLDPAIGSGSFYSAVRRVFPSGKVKVATGVEIDPRLARAARWLWSKIGLRVKEGDFTRLIRPRLASAQRWSSRTPHMFDTIT